MYMSEIGSLNSLNSNYDTVKRHLRVVFYKKRQKTFMKDGNRLYKTWSLHN